MDSDSTLIRNLGQYRRFLEISRQIFSTLDLHILLQKIVNAAAELTNAKAASILLYDANKHELYFRASSSMETPIMEELIVPVEGSIAGEILTTRKPMIILEAQEDPRLFQNVGDVTELPTTSLLGVPLIQHDEVIGVLEAINKRKREFSQDDQALLYALGSQAAVAITNARLFQQSDLIAEMVHELRTPLASIQTAAHLLSRPEISMTQRSSMAVTIQEEAQRLSAMASAFLDYAHLESGRASINNEEFNLVEVLQDTAEVMESRIKAQGLSLAWDLPEEGCSLLGDAGKIRQVAINLLSNAIKYNRPNGLITLGVWKNKKGAGFYVKDTGRGMLPEHIDLLFDKFYRVPGSESIAQGTGLGLSISKKIVEAHGGRIEVSSEIGKGTTFRVILLEK